MDEGEGEMMTAKIQRLFRFVLILISVLPFFHASAGVNEVNEGDLTSCPKHKGNMAVNEYKAACEAPGNPTGSFLQGLAKASKAEMTAEYQKKMVVENNKIIL